MDLGLLLGSPGDHFGVIWAPESPTWSVYVDFSVFFLVPLKRNEKLPKVIKQGAFLEAVDMAQVSQIVVQI